MNNRPELELTYDCQVPKETTDAKIEQIVSNWRNYNLRDNLYVNFDFNLDPVDSNNPQISVDRALNNINAVLIIKNKMGQNILAEI